MFVSNRASQPTHKALRHRKSRRSAFTLVEVMAASCVLMLGLGGVVMSVKTSLTTISHARHLGAASQIMQSEIERLRLCNWSQLQAVQDSGDRTVTTTDLPAGTGMTCSRTIRDVRDGLKEIIVEAAWGGLGGRGYSARLVTRYARNGINDYFYTSH